MAQFDDVFADLVPAAPAPAPAAPSRWSPRTLLANQGMGGLFSEKPAGNAFDDAFADLVPGPDPRATREAELDLAGTLFGADPGEVERTWGEVADDTALGIRRGARNVVSGLLSVPVGVANMLIEGPHTKLANSIVEAVGLDPTPNILEAFGGPSAIPQPAVVRGMQRELELQNQRDTEEWRSDKMRAQDAALQNAEGFWETTGHLIDNPSAAAVLGAEQVPQLAMGVPGSLPATLAVQTLGAAGQNEAGVAADLAQRVARQEITQEEADALAAQAFGESAVLNAGLAALPGARTLERIAANRARAVPGAGGLAHVLAGLAGEGTQGAVSEGGEQVIANRATGRDWDEGVGQAAALGLLLEGPMGGAGGLVEALAGRDAAAPRREQPAPDAIAPEVLQQANDQAAAAPPADPAPASPTRSQSAADDALAELDALLTQNVARAAQAEPAAAAAPQPAQQGGTQDNPLPAEREGDAPVGAWVAPPAGVDGGPLQVRMVPLDQVVGWEYGEDGKVRSAEKQADVARYAEAMRAGARFPNARGYERDDGKVRIGDGHRRVQAAREAGLTEIPMAVAPRQAAAAPAQADLQGGVPFMVTRAMREQLAARGMSPEQIAKLTPQQAQDVLAQPAAEAAPAPAPRAQPARAPKASKTDRLGRPADLLQVVASRGLDRDSWLKEGIDPAEFSTRVGINYLFRKRDKKTPNVAKGMTPNDLREWMQEEGYLAADPMNRTTDVGDSDAVDLFMRAFRGGEKIYAPHQQEEVARWQEAQAAANAEYERELRGRLTGEDFDAMMADAEAQQELSGIDRLVEQAYELGATDSDIVGTAFEADSHDHRAQLLRDLIENLEREADQRAVAGGPDGFDGQAQEGAFDDDGDFPGWDSSNWRIEQPRTPYGQPGLFGNPSPREEVDAERRRRDDQRNGRAGTGRTDMLAGSGELFAGRRPEQADVERAAGEDTGPLRVEDRAARNRYSGYDREAFGRAVAAARRAEEGLSEEARRALGAWQLANWDTGDLATDYAANGPITRELQRAFAPVREQLRRDFGETVPMYRGEGNDASYPADRRLFSWTANPTEAKRFATGRRREPIKPATPEEIDAAVRQYERTGFVSFRGQKYKRLAEHPGWYQIFDRDNNPITDGDDLRADLERDAALAAENVAEAEARSRVVRADVPVDAIHWLFPLSQEFVADTPRGSVSLETVRPNESGAPSSPTTASPSEASREEIGYGRPGDNLRVEQPGYHGTPYNVDRFRLDRIGTGEGNQAFGWGMYFASRREVAEHYRGGVGRANERTAELRPAALAAIKRNGLLGFDTAGEALGAVRTHSDFAERWELDTEEDAAALRAYRESFGNLYQVDIPEDSDLLDWDRTIEQQPEKVREAVEAIMASEAFDEDTRIEWNALPPKARTGRRFYTLLGLSFNVEGERGASEILLQHGIPGLRYLDGSSRGGSEGSHNYVIWDEGAISDPTKVGESRGGVAGSSRDMFVTTRGDRNATDATLRNPGTDPGSDRAAADPRAAAPAAGRGDGGRGQAPDSRGAAGDLPHRADYTPELGRRAQFAVDELVRRFGGSVLGDSIARGFRDVGTAQLLGQRVQSDEDLAAIAEVYRNPIYETMRYVFVDDAGKIVGESAVTSRMASAAATFPVKGAAGPQWLRETAEKFGASGVWLIHNHPSGDPSPSTADITVTRRISQELSAIGGPAVRGHVVLNHTVFSHIAPDGTIQQRKKIGRAQATDPLVDIRGMLIGRKVDGPADAAALAAEAYNASPEQAVAVLAIGARGTVRLAATLPAEALENRRIGGLLSTLGKRAGASFMVLASDARTINYNWPAVERAGELGLSIDTIMIMPNGTPVSLAAKGRFKGGYLSGRRTGRTAAMDRAGIGAQVYAEGLERGSDAGEQQAGSVDQTETPKFKRWFEGSKVVDWRGNPRVVYHGAINQDGGFDTFDRLAGRYATHGRSINAVGSWFTTSPEDAAMYAGALNPERFAAGGQTFPVYLAIKKPFRVSSYESLVAMWEVQAGGDGRLQNGDPERFRQALIEQGYDGLVIEGQQADRFAGEDSEYWVAFHPEQIKSATANSGDFDPANPSIVGDRQERYGDPTSSPQFRRWFGNSVVTRDGSAGGEPLTMYHGTAEEFDVFQDQGGSATGHATAALGHFFTPDRSLAGRYAENASRGVPADERVVDAYLAIERPYRMQLDEAQELDSPEAARAFRRFLERQGFDGIHIEGADVWVAFRPQQIKSASENNGDFDPANPSIVREEPTPYTADQQEFMRKAGLGDAVNPPTTMERLRRWAREAGPDLHPDNIIQSTFDRFHAIKRAAEVKGPIAPENDPYLAARLINTSSTMEAILRFGAPKLDNGVLKVNRDVPGLLDALAPVSRRMPQFLGWMVARRAEALKRMGREHLMTDEDIRAGLSLAEGHEKEFAEAATGYLKLKNAILDLAEQAGTIDPAARAAWDHAEYVPFYRQMSPEGEEATAAPGTREGVKRISAGIKELKGGKSALEDPLGNIIKNFVRLVDSAMKNRAMVLAVDQIGSPYFVPAQMKMKQELIPLDQVRKHLNDAGVDPAIVDGMPPEALEGVRKMLAIKAPEGPDILRIMRDGKPEYYHVMDPLLLRSMDAFAEAPTHWFVKMLGLAKNLLTAGATSTPDFIIRNWIRDTGEAAITAPDKYAPVLDSVRGAVDSLRESELTQDLMMAGAYFQSGLFRQGDLADTAKAIRRALRAGGLNQSAIDKYMRTVVNPVRWWEGYRKLAESTEMGSRIALARRRLEAGKGDVLATFEAKDFLDFQMRGDSAFVQFFIKVVPFLNARLQGMYRLGRVSTGKGRRGKVAGKLAMLATVSMALTWWNTVMYGDAYDELEEWDKDANWHIAPGTPYHLRIPKPFELGLVGGTMPERMYQAMRYALTGGEAGDRPEQTWDAFWHAITSTLAINPLPQAVKPAVESYTNYNMFFGTPIESKGDQYRPTSDRYSPTSTTKVSRYLSKGIEKLLGDENTVSPKKLDHLWRGYTGGMGMYLLGAADWFIDKAEGAPVRPERALRDFPVLGTVARGDNEPRSTRYISELYDLDSTADFRSAAVKTALEDGDEARAKRLEAEWGWLLGERVKSKQAKGGFMHSGVRELNKVTRAMAATRKEDQRIYLDRRMSAAEKREALDRNAAKRNELAKKLVRQIRERERSKGKG